MCLSKRMARSMLILYLNDLCLIQSEKGWRAREHRKIRLRTIISSQRTDTPLPLPHLSHPPILFPVSSYLGVFVCFPVSLSCISATSLLLSFSPHSVKSGPQWKPHQLHPFPQSLQHHFLRVQLMTLKVREDLSPLTSSPFPLALGSPLLKQLEDKVSVPVIGSCTIMISLPFLF